VTGKGRPGHSALDAALDIFRMRQYFNVIVRARDVLTAIREDTAFPGTVRRGLLPLPSDRPPQRGPSSGRCAGRPAAADGALPVSCPLAAAVGPAGDRAGQHLAGAGARVPDRGPIRSAIPVPWVVRWHLLGGRARGHRDAPEPVEPFGGAVADLLRDLG